MDDFFIGIGSSLFDVYGMRAWSLAHLEQIELLQAAQFNNFELREKHDPRPMFALQSTQLDDVIIEEGGRNIV